MVTLQILVLSFQVRILVAQQKIRSLILRIFLYYVASKLERKTTFAHIL